MLTLPATRLLIPTQATPERLLKRPRLLNMFTEKRHKLMLLVAPAGFGKTTLALEYLSSANVWQTGEAVAWLSLDLGGIVKWNARIFIQALSLALKNALPNLNLAQVEQELADIADDQKLTEDVAANLIFLISNALIQQARPVLLSIDDYHLVSDAQEVADAGLINTIVNTLLVTSPDQLRILIASRTSPNLNVLKLSMQDELLVIDKAQLRFTHSEMGAFLIQRGKTTELLDQVAEESEGWAAALTLKLQNLNLETPLSEQHFTYRLATSNRYNILAEEMFKQLDPALRRLLEASSILDLGIDVVASTRLISHYDGLETPAEVAVVETQFQRLETIGLLERYHPMDSKTEANSEPGKFYRMHNLLKEYLEKSLNPAMVTALNSIAGNYYHEIDDWALAFEHYLKADNHKRAAEILDERAYEQFRTGTNINELEQRLARLQDTALTAHPHLLLVAAMATHTAGHVDKSLAYYHASNRRWGRYEPLDRLVYSEDMELNLVTVNTNEEISIPRLLGKAETITCLSKLWEATGHNDKAMHALEGVKEVLAKLVVTNSTEEERRSYVFALALRHLGNCYRIASRINQSIEETTTSLHIFLQLGEDYQVACCHHNLGLAWRALGNQARSQENSNQSRIYWERQGNVYQLSIILNSLGNNFLNMRRYQEARDVFLEALTKTRDNGIKNLLPYTLSSLGDSYAGLQDRANALAYYAQAIIEASRQNNFEILAYGKLAAARTLRRMGEAAQAHQSILAALEYAEESNEQNRALTAVEYGAHQALFSRLELATSQLERALAMAQQWQEYRSESLAYFWLAYVNFRLNRQKMAYDFMRKALNVAQKLGYDSFLHEEAIELPEFAQSFALPANDPISAFFAHGDIYATDSTTYIELRAFGKGRILRGEQEVPSVSRKARELIFFLLEQKVPVSGERLAETLWPEIQLAGNGLGSAFYSTITHARRALGGPDTIRAVDGAYSLNVRYRYDVEQFEESLLRAEQTPDLPDRIGVLLQTLNWLSGDFLIDTDSEWIPPRREHLLQKKLRALRLLAQAYQGQGETEKALEIFGQWMEADPYDESPLRQYVELLAQIKSKTIALNFLRRKMERLNRENIEPEEQTHALFEQLDSARSIAKKRRA